MPFVIPDHSVRIRMFRPGLGDCFLLTFKTGGAPFHMLIDCGVFQGTPLGATRMREVAAAIKEETSKLDLVVLTHEHYDHLIGFKRAIDTFEQLEIGRVWMAWTENPSDPEAQELAGRFELGMQALKSGLAKLTELKSSGATEERLGLAFAQDIAEGIGGFFGLSFSENMRETRDWLMSRVPSSMLRFCEPGNIIELPELPRVRFYVLGPPRGAMLELIDPVTGEGDSYRHPLAPVDAADLWASAFQLDGGVTFGDDERLESARPFDSSKRVATEQAAGVPSVKTLLDLTGYDKEENAWRRIDNDWLQLTADLALQMNRYTNNSSLVFAIEFADTGRVLLFPGDAQVGNWRSWQEHTFLNGGVEVKVNELLTRTVFYKVGHHGSHNATHKKLGLEKMTSPELVAAIPTDEAFASTLGASGWKMPDPDVDAALVTRTRGRILRADPVWDPQPAAPPGLDGAATASFLARVNEADPDTEGRRLWIDYYVP